LQVVASGEWPLDDETRSRLLCLAASLLSHLARRTQILSVDEFVVGIPQVIVANIGADPDPRYRRTLFNIISGIFHDARNTPGSFPTLIESVAPYLIEAIQDYDDLRSVATCLGNLLQSVATDQSQLQVLGPSIANLVGLLIDLPAAHNSHYDLCLYEFFNKALEVLPALYEVFLNPTFLQRIFGCIRVDSRTFFAFRLIQRIIRETPKAEPIDLFFEYIDWETLKAMIDLPEDREAEGVEVLRFCQAYLEFGEPVIAHFLQDEVFQVIVRIVGERTFDTRFVAVQVFVTAIDTGTKEQILELLDMEVLRVFLETLEFGDSEGAAELMLGAIERMWYACEGGKEEEFLSRFRDWNGFDILMGMEVCTDQAHRLNELLDL
jgi:hypothetical protein